LRCGSPPAAACRGRGGVARWCRRASPDSETATALPSSWLGRIDNLTNFYLPQLAGFHWVLGVRPNSVLPAPETWRESIFLESGVLWFFWVGGIPLFIAFCFFAHRAFVNTGRVARTRTDDIVVAALAARARALFDPRPQPQSTCTSRCAEGETCSSSWLGLAANLNVPGPVPRHRPPDEGSVP